MATRQSLRKTWTVPECQLMIASGINLERYELVDGALIAKLPKGGLHNHVVLVLAELFRSIFGRLRVMEEKSIQIADITNQPEPDITVMTRDSNGKNPAPEEILLIVEISDSTLRDDLGRKAFLYARAGIRYYWVLDLQGRCIIAHRQPDTNYGLYTSIRSYRENEPIAIEGFLPTEGSPSLRAENAAGGAVAINPSSKA